jgi:hypothetical protein
MKKLFALLQVLVMLCGCLGAGEKIMGESIREEVFINNDPEHLRNEVIMEPGAS